MKAAMWGGLGVLLLGASAPLCAQADLPTLVQQLGSTDAQVRQRAYNELQRNRTPELLPLLGKQVATFPTEGQQFVFYLLQQQPIDQTRPLCEKLVGEKAPFLRAAAGALLFRHGDRSQGKLVAKALGEAQGDDRLAALHASWGTEDPLVTAAVRAFVRPESPEGLVTTALQRLAQMEKQRSEPTDAAARSLLAGQIPGVRFAALAWLARGDGDDAAKELATLLRAEPTRLHSVLQLLDRNRTLARGLLEAIAVALEAARAKHEVTQAVPLLQAQASDLLVPALRTLLAEGPESAQDAAIEALATVPGGLDGKALRTMLDDPRPARQLVAAATLRRMDDPSGLPVVLALLPKAGAQKAEAARVLGGFRDRRIVPALLDCLDDPNQQVRQNAWQGLQTQCRDLFPYRRFDFAKCGYDPNGTPRAAGIAALRAWWATVP